MHPHDVREFVETAVDELRAAALDSELPITAIDLDRLKLFVDFELTRYQASPMPSIGNGIAVVGAGIYAAGATVLSVPDLSVRPSTVERVILLELDDWDSQPPTAELLGANRAPLPVEEWPHKLTRRGLVNGHPSYPRPFFCRPGLREFHTHPQHEDEPWDEIRGRGIRLSALVLGLIGEIVDESLL